MDLRGVCIRVPVEAPIDVIVIDVMERIHPQFTPLDIEPSALGVTDSVIETDLEFCGGDNVVVRRGVDEWFKLEPEVTNPLERRKIDWPELTGTVILAHTASWWLASS
jgi:hypothetical protein